MCALHLLVIVALGHCPHAPVHRVTVPVPPFHRRPPPMHPPILTAHPHSLAHVTCQRETMRRERKRERERDMRLEVLGKKTKTSRDRERDITERIALGMQPAGAKLSGDAMYDQRLFNQSQGLNAGFKDEEDDDVPYDKAFRPETTAPQYRPRAFDADGKRA